ncbi:STY4851/ECs_5259 family protein [Mesorhizobium sp.]|uniref:STY4851/ECs_5259 family protein n=1 Tax=Mesorhizobium sp. TaxID=1871066 RepID=UPI00257E0090|nr:STY4851/ECs_5259 family protein [Mesorhizobium sp.]
MFQQRGDDPQFLDALNEELKQRDSDEAIDLQIKVVRARRALQRAAAPGAGGASTVRSGPVRDWLTAFLGARNMSDPDGQAIYRYRMTDSEYEQARKLLRHLASSGRLAEPDVRAGALFVAYCAEWFRRESISTFLRWDELAPDLFPSVPYSSKQELTELGLRHWDRPLRRSEHAREFLLTLALEGGFPVRILAEGARGWLKEYLRAVMRRAIAWRVDTPEEILVIAEEERGRMRKSYQHDDFVALCSELVERLLQLRQKAEAEGARQIRNSALLDSKYPGWRDELPIYVPAEDEALVTELLTGLLDERMTGLATEGVEARRYLVKRYGEWHPALQLLADGEIPPARLPGLSALGRVRAIPTGELGNHVTGEVALLEPPVGEQRRWRVRPFMRTARLLTGFPFSAPVTATLSSPGGAPHPWTWPRGDALRSEMLVFREDEGSTPNELLLRFLRSGSVRSPVKTLYVLVPGDWAVEPATEGAIAETEAVETLGCKLVRLTAAAYFRGVESDSVRFKVEPDTEGREQELELAPVIGAGFVLADQGGELLATPAQPLIREAGKQPRPPGAGELFIRRPGGRWTQHTGPVGGAGLIELSWRDPVANVQIEKRQLALVPGGARISGTMNDALGGEIRLQELPGWTASVQMGSSAVDAADSSAVSIRFTGRPVYRLPMTLRPPGGQPFDVIVPLVGRDAVIALADGSILAPLRQVDVGALRGAVAVAPRRTVIHLTAKGSKAGGLKAVVDGELPLGILRSAIDETLATLPGQDDLVELDFIGDSRPPIRISRYRHEQLAREGSMVRWLAPSGPSGVAPVARMILDPRHEHALEPAGDGAWRLPEGCMGLCLVYLRDGVDVVSRPVPVPLPGSPEGYAGSLVSALAMPDYEERQRTIVEALARLGRGEGSTDDFKWLRDAATNLNGLPASAFDALKLLPSSAETLIHLLLGAREAGERSSIWSLQNELPFLWLALPLLAWRSTMERDCLAVATALEVALGKRKAMDEAVAWLRRVCDELIAMEPALEAILHMAGLPVEQATDIPSLRDLTSGYIRGQHQRGGDSPNDLAARLASAGLTIPPEIETKSHANFAGLFAPVLLAASARGRLVLEHDQELLSRRTLREDPVYVSAAWRHLMKFYGSA